ncbi:MAG: hypothetical protein Ct9H300mP17_02040 [Candidatus Nitrosopelagicus sp.]|nr:MAG: hypothetical protein Ct9H300mP17_02040 [Candidatus Nitrosopelagicus sp.]
MKNGEEGGGIGENILSQMLTEMEKEQHQE